MATNIRHIDETVKLEIIVQFNDSAFSAHTKNDSFCTADWVAGPER